MRSARPPSRSASPGLDPSAVRGPRPRRGLRVHRAGDQRARDVLRHGARGLSAPRRSSTPARSSSRSPAPRSATPSSGRTSTRPSSSPRRCARAARTDLHPGRSLPDQREEDNRTNAEKEIGAIERADRGGDRRRLLQHRHRHLDARRPVEADARRAAGGQRRPLRPVHDVHPRARAEGVTVSVGGEIGEVGGKNSTSDELRAYMDGFNEALGARGAGHRARSASRPAPRTAASSRRRHGRRRRRSTSRRSRSCRRSRARSTASPARCSTAPRRCRRSASGSSRDHGARDPSRDRLPEHGVRAPAFPADLKREIVALARRERRRRAQAEATPTSSSSTRRARRRSARSRSACGTCPRGPAGPSGTRSRRSSRFSSASCACTTRAPSSASTSTRSPSTPRPSPPARAAGSCATTRPGD